MVEFRLAEILTATGGELINGNPETVVCGVTTDSRRVEAGQLFIALRGENFDGHLFAAAAVERGATAILVSEVPEIPQNIPLIRVKDTRKALGDLALLHRQRFRIPVIAVTGSAGKTTTKDLIAAAIDSLGDVVKTEGNFNNEIGLPLTLFKLTGITRAAVVEMGMRGLGEIRELTAIAAPSVGVVTNVGLTHLERLGSQANIARAKAELVEMLPGEGLAVLNADDPLVLQMAQYTKAPVLTYGVDSTTADWRAEAVQMKPESSIFEAIGPGECFPVELSAPGRHNILNALAAIAVARFLQVPIIKVQQGLAHLELTGKRLRFLETGGIRIIDDTYNASPASLRAALDVMAMDQTARRRIAVLGDMLELGSAAPALHREIGAYAARQGVDYLFTLGELAHEFGGGFTTGHYEVFQEKDALIARLQAFVTAGDLILVKGSRSMKMEQIVAGLAGEEVAE